jgi:hypothetical protein
VLGLVLLGLSRIGRRAAAAGVALWSLAIVVIGVVLLLMWFATRHVFMANNPTVALANPVWLVGVVGAIALWRGGVSRGLRSALRWLLVVAVIGSASAVLLGHTTSALEMAALLLPGHAAVVYAVDRFAVSRGQRS